MFSPTDTIVAIATAPVRAGIGVVRISGPLAHTVARAILTVPHQLEPRHATLTHVRALPASPEPDPAPSGEGGSPERRGAGGVSRVAVPLRGTRSQLTPDRSPREKRHRHGPSRAPLATPNPNSAPSGEGGSPDTRPPWSSGSSDGPASVGGASHDGDSPSGWSPGSSDPGNIDEVVTTYFPAPNSYTAEDVVEISAHGSLALLGEIVRAAIGAGARLAEPGEFTLRAYLNGRLDLVQAEAVADLVDAVTPLQARVAFDQLEGTLTRAIGALDEQLFDLAARLEASVDFPEEGYHFVEPGEAAAGLGRVRDGIDRLLATSASGRVIREGRHIAILGKPNVGKSSLFNQLVGTDRAIVAAGPGTTRDMLRETIDLDGIRLGLVDTAGIRASDDEVEQEGVVRARRAAGVADLVILMLDQSRPPEDVDRSLLNETATATRIVVVNKIDLPPARTLGGEPAGIGDWGLGIGGWGLETDGAGLEVSAGGIGDVEAGSSDPAGAGVVARRGAGKRGRDRTRRIPRTERDRAQTNPQSPIPNPKTRTVHLSLKTGEGLDALRAAMRAALDVTEPLRDAPMVTNVRHETLLRQARESIARAAKNVQQAGPSTPLGTGPSTALEAGEWASEELVLADIAEARRALEEVTGRRTSEDLLRRIFEKFCIGK